MVADLVIHAALKEVSTTSAPPPLDLPLPNGSGSSLTFGLLLPLNCTRLIGNFWTVMLSGVLKGLRSVCGVVALSSSLMKVGMGVFKNLGMGLAIVVDSGVKESGGVVVEEPLLLLFCSPFFWSCLYRVYLGRLVRCLQSARLVVFSIELLYDRSTTSPTRISLLVITSSATRLGGDSYSVWGRTSYSSVSLVNSKGPG